MNYIQKIKQRINRNIRDKRLLIIITVTLLNVSFCNAQSIKQAYQQQNSAKTTAKPGSRIYVEHKNIEHNTLLVEDANISFKYELLHFHSISNKNLLQRIYGFETASYSKEELLSVMESQKKSFIEWTLVNKNEGIYIDDPSYIEKMSILPVINNLLTVERDFYFYNGNGSGMGITQNIFYTIFDIYSYTIIELADIMKEMKSETALNDILRKYADVNGCFWDTPLPISDNFYFDKETVTFVYPKYKIACGIAGIVRITVPFSAIMDYLRPEFIKGFLKSVEVIPEEAVFDFSNE